MPLKKLRTNLRRIFILLILIWSQPNLVSLIIGASLIVLGQLIHFISAGYLVKQTRLITAGPYRFTRNPFYVGNLLNDLGLIIAAQNPWLGVIYLAMFYLIVIPRRIAKEEKYLEAVFGTDYLHYCKSVPRFVPRLRPTRMNQLPHNIESGFTWARIMHYRELWRIMRALGLIIIFYLQYVLGYSFLKSKILWSRLTDQALNIGLLITLLLILIIPPVWEYGFRKRKKL